MEQSYIKSRAKIGCIAFSEQHTKIKRHYTHQNIQIYKEHSLDCFQFISPSTVITKDVDELFSNMNIEYTPEDLPKATISNFPIDIWLLEVYQANQLISDEFKKLYREKQSKKISIEKFPYQDEYILPFKKKKKYLLENVSIKEKEGGYEVFPTQEAADLI